jgi:hypothetical protein
MKQIDKIVDNSGKLVSFATFANEYYNYHGGRIRTNYFDQARNKLIALAALKTGRQQSFINDLIANFPDIIMATPNQIPNLIAQFTTGVHTNVLLGNTRPKKRFRKQIERAFNYTGFRQSAKASWFAERFEIKACLYCNAQFTLAIGKDGTKKKLLFQLDHFYNKSDLPFLSLTLGNLIPSCSTCNISKSSKSFTLLTHIHPYHEDANIKFDFYIDQNNALEYLIGSRDYKLLKPKVNVVDPRFNSHKTTFSIEAIYEKHTDIVEELILKSLYYNQSRRDELAKEFADLKLSASVIDRFVLGNYSLDSEINRRPLAKLSKDIGKQLKIIK